MSGISYGTPADLRTGQESARMYVWNTSSLAWEASTKGSGTGQDVAVSNFPAVISGATVPTIDQVLNCLVPSAYDYISLGYTGSNLTTVLFKLGGVGGTLISTLTLGYDGSNNLTSVTKS